MNEHFQSAADRFHDGIPFIMEGQVMDTDDPDQMGRVRVWVPALDGEVFTVDQLPWAEYASPFMGFTVDFPAGGIPVDNKSHVAYGFWAIPKTGSSVLIFCLNANPAVRMYFAAVPRLHRNRGLPAGRNRDVDGKPGPWGDAGDGEGHYQPIQPSFDNLRDQFQNKMDESEAITRGLYERQVAQEKEEKDGKEGYPKNVRDKRILDPQTYCWVTPGRHAIIFQDNPEFGRLRLKTGEGHQVIFDDANERIYMSTAKGKTWLELDQDGHIHVFASESISLRAGKDINMYADRDINMEANRSFHVKANNGDIRHSTKKTFHVTATDNIMLLACKDIELDAGSSMHLTSQNYMDIKGNSTALTGKSIVDIHGGTGIIETAAVIHLNGPTARKADDAQCAVLAQDPAIVPGHEPWTRPVSAQKRGPNWRK